MAGRFRVTRFLGQGGMAQVFAAEDLELLGQAVALKVLRPDLPPDGPAARRFRPEALLARRVTHGNVCRLHDVFLHVEAGVEEPVLAMELLEGETLADRLSRGPLSPSAALPLLRQICAGLDAAHRAGVAHLDLKASNVLLVSGDNGTRAVLTDFGIARGPASPPAGPRCGTPAYMAPEQVEGGAVGPAADLYALGGVAHEMVTGRLPPASGQTDLPPSWDRAVRRCLERDPARRFASPVDFAAALPRTGVRSRLRAAPLMLAAALVWPTYGPSTSPEPLQAVARRSEAAGHWQQAARLNRKLGSAFANELRLTEAEQHFSQALALFRRSGDRAGEAAALQGLVLVDRRTGRFDSARRQAETAARLFHELGDRRREALARRDVADILMLQGRFIEAVPRLEEILALTRTLGDRRQEAETLRGLGLRIRYWRLDEAIRRLEQSLALCEQVGSPRCAANTLWMLAETRREAGDPEAARRHLSRARDLFSRADLPAALPRLDLPLARFELEQGEATQAADRAESAAGYFGSRGQRARQAEALTVLAEALLARGEPREAVWRLEQARALLQGGLRELGPQEKIELDLARSRVLGGVGRTAEAARLLREAEREARRMGLDSLRIEAAVARAAFDGCAGLPALEGEARAGGFVRLAREAAAARFRCEEGRRL